MNAIRQLANKLATCENPTEAELIEARELAETAAEQDCVASYALLGMMCHNGQGGAKDYVKAARCYQIAADAKVPEAMFHLALMHYAGEGGLCADRQKAYDWARLVKCSCL